MWTWYSQRPCLRSNVWKPKRRKSWRGHTQNHPGLLATIGMDTSGVPIISPVWWCELWTVCWKEWRDESDHHLKACKQGPGAPRNHKGKGRAEVEKPRLAPSILALMSGTEDRNRTLWRQGQDEKFDFRSRKLTQWDAVAKMARETQEHRGMKIQLSPYEKPRFQSHWE